MDLLLDAIVTAISLIFLGILGIIGGVAVPGLFIAVVAPWAPSISAPPCAAARIRASFGVTAASSTMSTFPVCCTRRSCALRTPTPVSSAWPRRALAPCPAWPVSSPSTIWPAG